MKYMKKAVLYVLILVLLTLSMFISANALCEQHDFDNGVVTLEPTCDTIGIITYTCKNCEEQVTNKISNLGHHFNEDGICTVCGQDEDGTFIGIPVVEAGMDPVLPNVGVTEAPVEIPEEIPAIVPEPVVPEAEAPAESPKPVVPMVTETPPVEAPNAPAAPAKPAAPYSAAPLYLCGAGFVLLLLAAVVAIGRKSRVTGKRVRRH